MRAFSNKKIFRIFCVGILILQLFQIIYFQRSFFLSRYDVSYWKDRLEHSQWNLPLSQRIMGDDGLFSYVGYRLIQGDDPSNINAETPPLGKYLIGISITILGNPAFYALFLGLGSLPFFYFIARRFLGIESSLFLITLFFLEPLFFSQLWNAWLDVAQLFFLFANLFFFFWFLKISKKTAIFSIFASGIMLGFFTQTKPAILFLTLFLIENFYLFLRFYKKNILVFLLGIVSGIFIVYLPYFFQGHTLIEFLKYQKYVASFYMGSKLTVHNGAIWQTLLFGQFPDIVTGISSSVREWWILWSIITPIGVLTAFYLFLKKNDLIIKGLSFFVLISLCIYTLIPSYPRYLIVILPFLYFFSLVIMEKFVKEKLRIIIFYGVLIYSLIHATLFLLPAPESFLKTFYYSFSHQYFQDVYQENLTKSAQSGISRNDFHFIALNAMHQAKVKSIEIKEEEKNIFPFDNDGKVKVKITYKTQDLGVFSQDLILKIKKENEIWKLQWDWDILFKNFKPGNILETHIIFGKRGKILDKKGNVLVEDTDGYLVSVNPSMIDIKKELEMLKFFEGYGYKRDNLYNEYQENIIAHEYIPLFTLFQPLNDKEKNIFLSYSGVSVENYAARIYRGIDSKSITNTFYKECCTRIYSSYNYNGIYGVEKQYNTKLAGFSGGTLIMKDKIGNVITTLIKKEPHNGGDILIK